MRIRWRGFELPSRVIRDELVSSGSYGRFVIEPFEQGFGTTIGNSLRRVLLSSLEGAAVTWVKIDGVSHEFTSIDGVLEDVTDILLNVKGIILKLDDDESRKITVQREKAGEVRAGDIVADPAVTIVNPDHLIATLTSDVSFSAEMRVAKSRGYATGSDNRMPDQEIGIITVDSVFSPVRRVRFRTEDMRVGQKTNYDRLTLEVWTNGTVSPEDALVEAGLILRKHLNPFVTYHELGEQLVVPPEPLTIAARPEESALHELLDKPVSALTLSVRASNCLDAAKITSLRELVSRTEADLLRFRSFGKTSLHEVQRKLAEAGLSLGMSLESPTEPALEAAPAGTEQTETAQGETTPSEATPAERATGEAAPKGDTAPGTPEEPAPDSTGGPSLSPNSGPMEAFTMGES